MTTSVTSYSKLIVTYFNLFFIKINKCNEIDYNIYLQIGVFDSKYLHVLPENRKINIFNYNKIFYYDYNLIFFLF